MSLETEVAALEISMVYDWGKAASIRREAESADVCEIHVLDSLANAQRDAEATVKLIRGARELLAAKGLVKMLAAE